MLIVIVCTLFAIILCVALHYKVMTFLAERHFEHSWSTHLLLPFGVLVIIFTHVVEIWIFGVVYYYLLSLGDVGYIIGNFDNSLYDCVYFSFVNYTSLGYGDLVPDGDIRYTAGLEALTGLVLIAWTASFTYIQIKHLTDQKNKK